MLIITAQAWHTEIPLSGDSSHGESRGDQVGLLITAHTIHDDTTSRPARLAAYEPKPTASWASKAYQQR
jgi:hypothetical protein